MGGDKGYLISLISDQWTNGWTIGPVVREGRSQTPRVCVCRDQVKTQTRRSIFYITFRDKILTFLSISDDDIVRAFNFQESFGFQIIGVKKKTTISTDNICRPI